MEWMERIEILKNLYCNSIWAISACETVCFGF